MVEPIAHDDTVAHNDGCSHKIVNSKYLRGNILTFF